MGSETELKFQLDPVALQQLRRHPLLGRLKQEKARTRLEKSAYFDTAEGHLRAQGAVLRIRTIGRRRIQTLKTTDEKAGAWSRNEWEWDIFDDVPDLRLLTDTPLAETIGQTNLQAVFSTEIRRTTYLLSEPGWTVELALDQGQVLAGPYSAPVTEAELELKSGDADHLFQLALSLTQNLSARLSLLTKAKRGFALLEQAPLTSSKARTISLDGAMNATAALRQIALSCIAHFVTNQDYLAM
ncbi:MAG TPA: CYTH domain-containing protein, partial [Rhodospirillaceae bacterium]|nr:CYTH domain-containing protein [Rhodospirillaceae bacterium]